MKPAFAPAVARPAPRPAAASRSAAAVPRFVSTPLGAGSPLSTGVKPRLEHSFGTDLSGVRVHTENSASRVADAVGAKAFAHGTDIVLSSRASANDLGLMAHETAHVLQQNGGPARVQTFGGALGCGYEREAHSASAAAMRGERYRIALYTGGPYPQFGFWSSLVSAVTEGIGGLIDKAIAYIRDNARSIPGYDLLAVAIGKDPLTQQTVDRSAANIIKGLMGLIPGGAAMFENIQKAGVIQRAADWVDAELKRLNLSWERVKATISEFIGSLGASDLLDLGGVFTRAKRIFRPLVSDIVTFAKGAAAKLFEFIFEGALALAGSAGQAVLAVLRKAGAVLKQIMEDPIGFLNNLLAAVFGGFRQFGANILTHLKNAIFDWLFGAMAGAGIQLPKKFDLKGILSVVLQVLGLTWQNMRGKLVRVLGEPVVAGLEKTFEFIKLIVTEGIGAAWQKILEFASGITDTVIEGIKSWVKTTIVGQAITKIISMANPAGAIIQAVIAIYNTVMFVIERAKQIMAFVNSVTDSIANIAAGRISAAINYVEQTLARILPLVISFLARFIGLGGISAKIKDIIAKIRAPIDKAIDKIVDWLATQAKALAAKVVSAVRSWLGLDEPFTGDDGTSHHLIIEGSEKSPRAVVHSAIFDVSAAYAQMAPVAQKEAKPWKEQLEGSLAELKTLGVTGAAVGNREAGASDAIRKQTNLLREAMRELTKLFAKYLFPRSGASGISKLSDLPTPVLNFHPVPNKANKVTIEKLSANRTGLKGSEPDTSNDVRGWKFIRAAGLTTDDPNFVKLHLINAKFGGPGQGSEGWKNLVPATKRNNSMHLGSVENVIKEAVGWQAGGAKDGLKRGVVWYEAVVTYHTSASDWTDPVKKAVADSADDLHGKLVPGDFAQSVQFTWGFHDPKMESDNSRKWDKLGATGTFVLPVPLPRFTGHHLGRLRTAAKAA